MKTFHEHFKDRIDGSDGTVVLDEAGFKLIQFEASVPKIAYYAHCKAIYNTPQERRDIELLQTLGFVVVNPSDAKWEARWKEHEMAAKDIFASECDLIVFRALPGGLIPQGVWKEIAAFKKLGRPILELPSSILTREMSLEATREYLAEVGQR